MASDRLFRVPPGTRHSVCGGRALGGTCAATVYWIREYDIRSRETKSIAVDCDRPGLQRPSEAADDSQADLFAGTVEVREGFGLKHQCPDQALFARRFAELRERQSA